MTSEEWNCTHPVGTPVRYFPVKGSFKHTDTKTRSEAWTLSSGQHVVLIEARSGAISLDHLEVLADPMVDRPAHYDGDECMKALESAGWARDGCLFNIAKYLWRLGSKHDDKQDAQKALWYATRLRENDFYGKPLTTQEYVDLVRCFMRGHGSSRPKLPSEVTAIVNEALAKVEP